MRKVLSFVAVTLVLVQLAVAVPAEAGPKPQVSPGATPAAPAALRLAEPALFPTSSPVCPAASRCGGATPTAIFEAAGPGDSCCARHLATCEALCCGPITEFSCSDVTCKFICRCQICV